MLFIINCVRILTAGLLFTGVFGIIYSMAGGILSILVMYILYKSRIFGTVGISMAGGVLHNFGQLIMACIIMSNVRLMSYFFCITVFRHVKRHFDRRGSSPGHGKATSPKDMSPPI